MVNIRLPFAPGYAERSTRKLQAGKDTVRSHSSGTSQMAVLRTATTATTAQQPRQPRQHNSHNSHDSTTARRTNPSQHPLVLQHPPHPPPDVPQPTLHILPKHILPQPQHRRQHHHIPVGQRAPTEIPPARQTRVQPPQRLQQLPLDRRARSIRFLRTLQRQPRGSQTLNPRRMRKRRSLDLGRRLVDHPRHLPDCNVPWSNMQRSKNARWCSWCVMMLLVRDDALGA